MVSIATVRQMALSFPEVVELPHFEKTSFKINLPGRQAGKKIFTTLAEKNNMAVVNSLLLTNLFFVLLMKQLSIPLPEPGERKD